MDKEELSPFLNETDGDDGLGNADPKGEELGAYSDQKLFSVTSPKSKKILLCCLFTGLSLVIILVAFSAGIAVGHFAVPHSKSGASPYTPTVRNSTQDVCSNPPVLLISLDGFWSGYLKRNFTPFIQSLAASGVKADYMRSEFPTKTFPNHFSIVTGLHPESHGIVNNYFYDSLLNDKFYIGSPSMNDPKWWLGEPIWVTAVKQGLKTAVYFWPGSEVDIDGVRPTHYFPYDSKTSYETRVNTVLNWLDLPNATRPQFIAAYFDEPDESGHMGGPNSDLVNSALSRVDKTMQSLFDGLKERKVEDCVNVIITSDHGMTTYNSSKLVHLNQLLPSQLTSQPQIIYGVVADIFVPQGANHDADVRQVYDSLVQNGSDAGLPFRVYHKANLPFRLHAGYFNKQRYGDIYLIGDEGSYLTTVNSSPSIGEHGYDNILENVEAIFIGHGPAFRKGYVSEAFANIELYNLMCSLLGISPSPNNGTVGSLYHMLTPSLLPTLPPPQTFQGSEGVRDSCPYPTDEDTYNMRSFCDECVCRNQTECADVSNTTINDSNMLLNPSAEQIIDYQNLHLPWGVPNGGEGSSSCLLTQQDYVTLYSNTLRIPLWSAFKLTRQQASISQLSGGCLRRDPRIPPPNSSNCTHYATEGGEEFVAVRLAAALSTSSTAQQLTTNLLSNVVPQMTKFNTRVWLPLEEMLRSWAANFSNINIILGSVLDVDRDGKRDSDNDYSWWTHGKGGVAIPSHFYAIVVRCKSEGMEPADCKPDQLDALGLLFQHPTENGDPSPTSKLLRYALTPIRDIERVTGVSFFPALKVEDKNTLEMRLTNELWLTQ